MTALRSIRSQMGIAPSKAVPLLLQDGDASDRERLARYTPALKFLAKLESITWLDGEAPAAAAALVGSLKLLIPLEGLIDLGAETARLDKELKRIAGEIAKCQGKLSSETFVQNAPAAVVQRQLDAYNAQDLDAHCACFADDVVVAGHAMGGMTAQQYAVVKPPAALPTPNAELPELACPETTLALPQFTQPVVPLSNPPLKIRRGAHTGTQFPPNPREAPRALVS